VHFSGRKIDQLMRLLEEKHCSYDYDEINLISAENSEFLRQKAVIDNIVGLERKCGCDVTVMDGFTALSL
jgi:hypothetical protein